MGLQLLLSVKVSALGNKMSSSFGSSVEFVCFDGVPLVKKKSTLKTKQTKEPQRIPKETQQAVAVFVMGRVQKCSL